MGRFFKLSKEEDNNIRQQLKELQQDLAQQQRDYYDRVGDASDPTERYLMLGTMRVRMSIAESEIERMEQALRKSKVITDNTPAEGNKSDVEGDQAQMTLR